MQWPRDLLAQYWFNLYGQLLMRAAPRFGVAILWMAALLASWASPASDKTRTDSLYEQLADLNAQLREESGQSRGDAVVVRYRQLTAGIQPCAEGTIHGFNNDDLFRATAYAEFYSLEAADVDVLGCLYRKLAAAGGLTDWHTQTYAGALVTVARYSEANELRRHSGSTDLPVLPQLKIPRTVVGSSFRLIALEDRMHARVEAWTPEKHRARIVAVVHPTCAFSVRALSEIEQKPELQWIRDNLLLVVPPDTALAVNGILAWNTAHPKLQMHPMYLRHDWKALTSLDTPTFYLVQDGKVLTSFEGWPNSKGLAALQATVPR
ncbi:hypothetical protein NRY95_06620 [Xanthomonas campestris pv. phormiicola]|nr:hypothetical protein [Xanthomonas campestris pv. phormiicola]UYC17625.1 hypothetical protein NRY95_06620 [Xanthomonas campestris pv. phormiicola]